MTVDPRLHMFAMYSWAAGSARVRLKDWADHLELDTTSHNYAGLSTAAPRALVANPSAIVRAESQLRSFDPTGRRVIVSREVSPFSRGGREESLLRGAAHGTYDFDDALFADTSLRRHLTGGTEKAVRSVRAADVVIAGNDYLADWAGALARDVRVVPSCVEPSDYVRARERAPEQVPRLVWLGSATTEQFLVPLIPELRRVHDSTGATLRVISSPTGAPELDALGSALERVPWSPDTFAQHLAEGDVALAPLTDTPFSRGKCAYKILQYGASGLPVVGSPVGANRLALERLDGVLVDAFEDWGDAILQVLGEPTSRTRVRAATATDSVKRHYSFAAWSDVWCDAVGIER